MNHLVLKVGNYSMRYIHLNTGGGFMIKHISVFYHN
jgi:hypothetical protein